MSSSGNEPIAGHAVTGYLGSALAVAAATAVAAMVAQFFALPNPTVLMLVAVLFGAVRWGRGPALFAAAAGVVVSSYLFMAPIGSFHVPQAQDVVNLAMFVLAALLTSDLAARVRGHAQEATRRAQRLDQLYTFSRAVAGMLDGNHLLEATSLHCSTLLRRRVVLLLPAADGLAQFGARASPPAFTDEQLLLLAVRRKAWPCRSDPGSSERSEVGPPSLRRRAA